MTTEQCTSICQTGGYTIAGTEYGTQCLCGSQLFQTNGAGVSTTSSDCNMPCSGNCPPLFVEAVSLTSLYFNLVDRQLWGDLRQ